MCIVIIIKSYFYINKNYYYKNNKIIYLYIYILYFQEGRVCMKQLFLWGLREVRHCKPWTQNIIDLFGSIRSNEIFLDMIIIPGTIHVHIEIAREHVGS